MLQDHEGKQLLAEAVYLLGVILLFIDQQIPGEIREDNSIFLWYKGGCPAFSTKNIYIESRIKKISSLKREIAGFLLQVLRSVQQQLQHRHRLPIAQVDGRRHSLGIYKNERRQTNYLSI